MSKKAKGHSPYSLPPMPSDKGNISAMDTEAIDEAIKTIDRAIEETTRDLCTGLYVGNVKLMNGKVKKVEYTGRKYFFRHPLPEKHQASIEKNQALVSDPISQLKKRCLDSLRHKEYCDHTITFDFKAGFITCAYLDKKKEILISKFIKVD